MRLTSFCPVLRWDCQAFFLICQVNSHNYQKMSRVVVSTAAFHARVRGSFPSLSGLKETKMFLPHPLVNTQNCGEPL